MGGETPWSKVRGGERDDTQQQQHTPPPPPAFIIEAEGQGSGFGGDYEYDTYSNTTRIRI